MARGQPDYGQYQSWPFLGGMVDLGEVAVRQGGITPHDRKGFVLWYDDFQSGLSAWQENGSGTGAAAAISSLVSKRGGFSCKLTCGSTSSLWGRIDHISKYPGLGRFGFEISFTNPNNVTDFIMLVYIYTGARLVYCGLKWDEQNSKFYYYYAGWQEKAADLSLVTDNYTFHTMKAVVDSSAEEYLRIMIDGHEYDMADVAAQASASVISPELMLMIYYTGESGQNRTGYVTDAIITINEP